MHIITDMRMPGMSLFDLRTAFVVMGMLYLIMPITVWFALRHVKARSVIERCVGDIVFGLGLACACNGPPRYIPEGRPLFTVESGLNLSPDGANMTPDG